MEGTPPESKRRIKSYVLRAGRVTEAQKRSYGFLSEKYLVPFEEEPANPQDFFGNEDQVSLEIGFGMGTATAIIAEANPGKNYLGIEVHRPGIGKLLWEIEKRGLANVRIIEHDAVEVLEKMIYPASFEAVHIFFPDPWPKKRHHKRRLVTRPFTDTLACALKPDGYLYMVTDWEDYAKWALTELGATPGLSNPCGGFSPAQEWRPRTKFEQKGLDKNRKVWELFFNRDHER
ncbi:MAG: tRNA (guanosine(46)-N7)-methyltransferase TrmB [Treponema sp.]|jgi:tRNA (guanine-N7-)-methyltransferase|nr:tRNA (guanosine(46)-N7)-methyltransferase TrmB [Treponema sp.]